MNQIIKCTALRNNFSSILKSIFFVNLYSSYALGRNSKKKVLLILFELRPGGVTRWKLVLIIFRVTPFGVKWLVCVLFRIMLSSRRSGELKNWPKKENNKGIETFLLYIYSVRVRILVRVVSLPALYHRLNFTYYTIYRLLTMPDNT